MLIIQNSGVPAAIRNAVVDIITPDVSEIRVASAYVTCSGSRILFDAVIKQIGLENFNNIPKTLVTSFDFGLTEPDALREWYSLHNSTVLVSGEAQLHEGSLSPKRAFHPKLYTFGIPNNTCSTLVGSANLTGRGFSINTEAAWVQRGVNKQEIDKAFELATLDTTLLTEATLILYEEHRKKNPPAPEIVVEVTPPDEPEDTQGADLPQFRKAIEDGDVNPQDYEVMWVKGEGLQGGSRNQLELPRGGHRFFGFNFTQYDYPDKITIGEPVLRNGSKTWDDRLLTWHGNNRMERMNLPTIAQGGFDYTNTAVMFRRLRDGSFEIIVEPWDSDMARAWRNASAQKGTIYRLGTIATNRTVGLI